MTGTTLHEGELWRAVRPDLVAEAVLGESTASLYVHGICIGFVDLSCPVAPGDSVTINFELAGQLRVNIVKRRR